MQEAVIMRKENTSAEEIAQMTMEAVQGNTSSPQEMSTQAVLETTSSPHGAAKIVNENSSAKEVTEVSTEVVQLNVQLSQETIQPGTETVQENDSSRQEAVRIVKEDSSAREITKIASETVQGNTSSSQGILQTGSETGHEHGSFWQGIVQMATNEVQEGISSETILQTERKTATQNDTSSKEITQMSTETAQENIHSSQEILQQESTKNVVKRNSSSSGIVQTVTGTVEKNNSSSQNVIQTTTDSTQEHGPSTMGIIHTAIGTEQEKTLSSEVVQTTTDVVKEHNPSQEDSRTTIRQPSTTIEMTADIAVAETKHPGIGSSSDTVSFPVQDMFSPRIQPPMPRTTADSEAVASNNMNVLTAPGSAETTRVTMQDGSLVGTAEITTKVHNLGVKSAAVQETSGYDVNEYEGSIRTVNKTSFSTETKRSEVRDPSVAPSTPVKRNTIPNLLPGALGVAGASRKFLKMNRTPSADKPPPTETPNKVVTLSLTYIILY